jgi:hypothetical protein
MASVRALPLASHLREPEFFYHYGVNGSWDDCVANVFVEALRDVATIEDGKVVEWRDKRNEQGKLHTKQMVSRGI